MFSIKAEFNSQSCETMSVALVYFKGQLAPNF